MKVGRFGLDGTKATPWERIPGTVSAPHRGTKRYPSQSNHYHYRPGDEHAFRWNFLLGRFCLQCGSPQMQQGIEKVGGKRVSHDSYPNYARGLHDRENMSSKEFLHHFPVIMSGSERGGGFSVLSMFRVFTGAGFVVVGIRVAGRRAVFENGFLPGASTEVARLCSDDLCSCNRDNGTAQCQVFEELRHLEDFR